MGKQEDIEHYAWVLKTIGERILINSCSSALFVICKSPIYRHSKIYWESLDNFNFIKDNGIKRIAEVYHLDIDSNTFLESFYDKAYYIKDKYYADNTSL